MFKLGTGLGVKSEDKEKKIEPEKIKQSVESNKAINESNNLWYFIYIYIVSIKKILKYEFI